MSVQKPVNPFLGCIAVFKGNLKGVMWQKKKTVIVVDGNCVAWLWGQGGRKALACTLLLRWPVYETIDFIVRWEVPGVTSEQIGRSNP